MSIKLDLQQPISYLCPTHLCPACYSEQKLAAFFFIFFIFAYISHSAALASHFNLRISFFLFQYLSQKTAQAIDVELMSPTGGGFSFEQLVELGRRPRRQNVPKPIYH